MHYYESFCQKTALFLVVSYQMQMWYLSIVYLGLSSFNYFSFMSLLPISVRCNWVIIMVKSIKFNLIKYITTVKHLI